MYSCVSFSCFLVTGNILGNSRLIVQRSIFLFFFLLIFHALLRVILASLFYFTRSFSLSLLLVHSLPRVLSLSLSLSLFLSTIRATMASARSDRHDDHWSRSLIDMSVGFYPVNCVAPACPRESVVHLQPLP